MDTEIEYAVNFLADFLKERLPLSEEQVGAFRKSLTVLLKQRYENHWYEDKPLKGSAYRCINVSVEENSVDEVLRKAAQEFNFTAQDLLKAFNKGLALWVDPKDVSCRLGKGAIFPIYKKIADTNVIKAESPPFVPMSGQQRRPQQRPRSISPRELLHLQQPAIPTYHSRPKSSTPPGFSSTDAGKMFSGSSGHSHQQMVANEDINMLWGSAPTSKKSQLEYSGFELLKSSASPPFSNMDSSYSFNQYSSYYKPSSYGKKSTQMQSRYQRPAVQSDEIYQRYHWSRNDMGVRNDFGHSYNLSRHAQEVY